MVCNEWGTSHLIKINKYYYCPILTFLVWRITSGLYFDLVDDKAFGDPFGFAFQDYVQEVSNKILNSKITSVIPEHEYFINKERKNSVDIILLQKDACFFVEAKAKRMQSKSKIQLLSNDAIEKDLNIIATGIVQTYKTINHYRNGYYPNLSYSRKRKVFPLIVTLEDWFLMGDHNISIKEKVKTKLVEESLPESFLNEMPYSICSMQNYEHLVQILNSHSIREIMSGWFIPEKEDHNFGQYLISRFNEEYKPIDHFFPGDFEKIFPDGLIG